jgi:hypothetical protein
VRAATLATVAVGWVVFVLDFVLVPAPHAGDPFWWLSLALCATGVLVGTYIRRHDRRLGRVRVDGAGVTAALRARYGLWEPTEPR